MCLALANCASSGKFAGQVDPNTGCLPVRGCALAIRAEGRRHLPRRQALYRGRPDLCAEEDVNYREEGLASWYGAISMAQTANGEVFDMESLSAAHPTLPMPSYARVTISRTANR